MLLIHPFVSIKMSDRQFPIIFSAVVGIFTFWVPFFAVLVPQWKAYSNSVVGVQYMSMETNNGTFEMSCSELDVLAKMPECFDPMFASHGRCPFETRDEFYHAWPQMKTSDGQNITCVDGLWLLNVGRDYLNALDEPLLPNMRWFCEKTFYYDSEKMTTSYYTDPHHYFDGTAWAMTFLIGGGFGFLILISLLIPLVLPFLVIKGLLVCVDGLISTMISLRIRQRTVSSHVVEPPLPTYASAIIPSQDFPPAYNSVDDGYKVPTDPN